MKCEVSELRDPRRHLEGTQAYSKARHMFYIVKKYDDGTGYEPVARWFTNSGPYVLAQELPDDAVIFKPLKVHMNTETDITPTLDIISGAFICTEERPYTKGEPGIWVHPDSTDNGSCSNDCCDYYICNICKDHYRIEHSQ
jgi:hypothetical protein